MSEKAILDRWPGLELDGFPDSVSRIFRGGHNSIPDLCQCIGDERIMTNVQLKVVQSGDNEEPDGLTIENFAIAALLELVPQLSSTLTLLDDDAESVVRI